MRSWTSLRIKPVLLLSKMHLCTNAQKILPDLLRRLTAASSGSVPDFQIKDSLTKHWHEQSHCSQETFQFLFLPFQSPHLPLISSREKFQLPTWKESCLFSKRSGCVTRVHTRLGSRKDVRAGFLLPCWQSLYHPLLFASLLAALFQAVWPILPIHTHPSCPSPTLPPSRWLCLSSSPPISKKETLFPNFHIPGRKICQKCQMVPSPLHPCSWEPPRTLRPGPFPAKVTPGLRAEASHWCIFQVPYGHSDAQTRLRTRCRGRALWPGKLYKECFIHVYRRTMLVWNGRGNESISGKPGEDSSAVVY